MIGAREEQEKATRCVAFFMPAWRQRPLAVAPNQALREHVEVPERVDVLERMAAAGSIPQNAETPIGQPRTAGCPMGVDHSELY